jgi:hypothetical protein
VLLKSLSFQDVKVKIYGTMLPSVVLYGCETWSLTLRKEHRLRVFENRVLRRVFGPKRDEVTGEREKMYKKELHILYSSPNIIRQIKSRRMSWADMWHAWERRETVKDVGGKTRRKDTT